MAGLLFYLIRECFAPLFCIAVISIFLIADRYKNKELIGWFTCLLGLVAIESVCGGYEKYLCEQPDYVPVRLFLSWVCYLVGPAIILVIIEIILRNNKPLHRMLFAIPEAVNLVITSLAFFTNLVFYYDSDNSFHTGPLAIVPRSTMVIYLAILLIVGCSIHKRNRRECLIIIVCVLFLTADVINEIFDIVSLNLRPEIMAMSVLAYFLYFASASYKEEVRTLSSNYTESEQAFSRQMIDQTIETLAFTIDAKDKYTRGHSFRVARYARQIARLDGKSEDECREIYLAGLLHDIGKISIRDSIINKSGKLSEDEYHQIKKHPDNGAKILNKMKNLPSLKDGAHYHHERYDGQGYPNGWSGEEIPEMARIIAVADAYDAMTSHRTYRKTMDQADAKQEIWKGMGTQFDPHFAKIMISLIDSDLPYDMREKPEDDDTFIDMDDREIIWGQVAPKSQTDSDVFQSNEKYDTFGEFIASSEKWARPVETFEISEKIKGVELLSQTKPEKAYVWYAPSVILFSSSDGEFLGEDYEELGVFLSAGYNWRAGSTIKAITSLKKKKGFSWDKWVERNKEGLKYVISTYKEKEMIYIEFDNELSKFSASVRLPEDYSKDVYIGISGERCKISECRLL